MVVGYTEEQADQLFHALSDRTRRDILTRAINGEHSVSALARLYPMSFAAVQKHVAVLEKAGLVVKEKTGRRKLVTTNIDAVRTAQRLLEVIEDIWKERLERFEDVLVQSKKENDK